MTSDKTPVEYYPEFNLFVKREDLCNPDGPHFSKARGVFPHVKSRYEGVIGVLDTYHSRGGWAVAQACKLLDKQCKLFYPVRKHQSKELQIQQAKAAELGAELIPLQAGRSSILYHQAKKFLGPDGYMMPNALKLPESVSETAAEVLRTDIPQVDCVLISASSGTIAAGVIQGLRRKGNNTSIIVHLGYSRSAASVRKYLRKMSGENTDGVMIINEGYSYADEARPGPTPPFPCNSYYDLKAFRAWVGVLNGPKNGETALLWNIG